MSREWDGKTYDRISGPMQDMAGPVLDRLVLRGDETVVDAGCGSGRVTEQLLEKLPDGHVIAVDASAAMLAAARARVGEERVTFLQQDLAALDLGDEPADAILSTATFHWIADQAALYWALRGALKPGGRLVAQCGGEGNIADVRAAVGAVIGEDEEIAARLAGFDPWRFPALADRFIAAVHEHLGGDPLSLAYVRLNIDATAL
jgi:trans-aconitate 2-methyltransferase